MNSLDEHVLDVRPVIAAGGDPFDQILAAAARVQPGGSLVIINSFEPFPLYDALARTGFDHEAARLADGDWRVTFRRRSGSVPATG